MAGHPFTLLSEIMKKQYCILTWAILGLSFVSGCATNQETNPVSGQTNAVAKTNHNLNDYPTRDRVDYVLTCIAEHGGLNFITQYACGCKIDKIAEIMPFAEYDAAKTYSNLRGVPGESGAVFRDPKQSKDLKKKLKEAEAAAEKSCFVK